jgi:Mannosyltransferase (PIG-V)
MHTDETALVAADPVAERRDDVIWPELWWAAARLRTFWRRRSFQWKLAFWVMVTMRIGLGLVAILSTHLFPAQSNIGQSLRELLPPGHDVWTEILSTWQRWDALWYQHIATEGYQANNLTTAFYPLYPLVSRIVSWFLFGQIVPALLVVSSVSFAIALWLLYKLARLDADRHTARLTVALLAAFPMGFFFLAPYTESLYLVLTVATFWFSRTGRPWLAGGLGFFAALTRSFGVFLVLPLLYEYVRRQRTEGKRFGPDGLPALLPVAGWLVFTLYQRVVIGETRSTLSTLGWFGDRVVRPWEAISASWSYVQSSGDPVEGINLLSMIGFALVAIWVTRRLNIGYALYIWPYLGLLYCRQSFFPLGSDGRYLSVLFPCFIMVAIWLRRWPWLAAGCLVVSGLVQIMMFQFWVLNGFVG